MTNPNHTTVLITGASSGFGEEFARQYAQRGHRLVLVARRKDRLESLAETLRQQYNVNVLVEPVDLSDLAAVTDLHARLTKRGVEVDVLINNAGHGLHGPFLDNPLDAALSMIQLDIASLTAMTHVFGQDMRKRKRGQILQIASILAYQGVEQFAVYSAAKAYVLRFGDALHREFKRDNVTVTTLCPGLSDTGFISAAEQRVTPQMQMVMMQTPPVVRAGIRALDAGRISVVAGLSNKLTTFFMWATPRRIHQAVMSRILNAG
ncbi:MAG: SDR family oxidoreductase [Saccharospirillum sp.]|uniref:SDR family NAD(P)-dependent oxidoreductase n=1 Tax=Saccharospirillum sp. TaxID=2033801 RepID=UPI00329763E5